MRAVIGFLAVNGVLLAVVLVGAGAMLAFGKIVIALGLEENVLACMVAMLLAVAVAIGFAFIVLRLPRSRARGRG